MKCSFFSSYYTKSKRRSTGDRESPGGNAESVGLGRVQWRPYNRTDLDGRWAGLLRLNHDRRTIVVCPDFQLKCFEARLTRWPRQRVWSSSLAVHAPWLRRH